MSEVKLSTEGIRYIALFENLTGATAKDCVIDEENDRVIFVVKKGEMGLAIGKGGSSINGVKKAIGKHVEIVEHSEDVNEFIRNVLHPVPVKNVNVVSKKDKRLAFVEISPKDKGFAIGRDGRNIQKAKMLAQRHHGICDIVIQ